MEEERRGAFATSPPGVLFLHGAVLVVAKRGVRAYAVLAYTNKRRRIAPPATLEARMHRTHGTRVVRFKKKETRPEHTHGGLRLSIL